MGPACQRLGKKEINDAVSFRRTASAILLPPYVPRRLLGSPSEPSDAVSPLDASTCTTPGPCHKPRRRYAPRPTAPCPAKASHALTPAAETTWPRRKCAWTPQRLAPRRDEHQAALLDHAVTHLPYLLEVSREQPPDARHVLPHCDRCRPWHARPMPSPKPRTTKAGRRPRPRHLSLRPPPPSTSLPPSP